LVRHGQTDWNLEGRWQGHADIPLNSVGRKQAAKIAAGLVGIGLEAIFSSDLQRAAETAQALSSMTGLAVHYDPRLREIHQGEWQGLVMSEVEARFGDLLRSSRLDPLSAAAPGGESGRQLRDRLVQVIDEIVNRHPTGRVAVVSHGYALAMLQVHFLGLPFERIWDLIPPNEEIRVLEINPPLLTRNNFTEQ
jgi:broad specificity phosphatase PhoE